MGIDELLSFLSVVSFFVACRPVHVAVPVVVSIAAVNIPVERFPACNETIGIMAKTRNKAMAFIVLSNFAPITILLPIPSPVGSSF